MNPKAILFEMVLTEFNWGQHNPANRLANINDFDVDENHIRNEGDLKTHIARYLNWSGAMAHADRTNKTGHFKSPAILAKRNSLATAMYDRLVAERPNHPALIVLAKDLHAAALRTQQDLYSLYLVSWSGSKKLKLTHSF